MDCPIPIADYPSIQMAHGAGGALMRRLITDMFEATFGEHAVAGGARGLDSALARGLDSALARGHDSAVLDRQALDGDVAFTTDSYVVKPLVFPGGSIGSLAVNGTANDLLMAGALPVAISVAFILEEGLEMETLWGVVQDIAAAAASAGVEVVTGDTKVVDRGKADGLFVTTAGVGRVVRDGIHPRSVRPGDAVILSGDIGRHGVAIMATREGMEFDSEIESDCACVLEPARALLDSDRELHCLRDLTRGGLASAVIEIATTAGCSIQLEESRISVRDDVHAACEILGLDPIYVANEGRFVAVVPEEWAPQATALLRTTQLGRDAAVVGHVVERGTVPVWLRTRVGGERPVSELSGEQLPRIC